MGQLHDGLAGSYYLSWFSQSLHHGPVSVGNQERIVSFVPRDVGLSFDCSELCLCGIRSGLDLVVGRRGNGAGAN
jgi:hypothetical protein